MKHTNALKHQRNSESPFFICEQVVHISFALCCLSSQLKTQGGIKERFMQLRYTANTHVLEPVPNALRQVTEDKKSKCERKAGAQRQ